MGAASLSIASVPAVAVVAIDGVDYEVRPFSIGRALKLRAPIEVLQRAAPRKDGEEDGYQREPVDPGEWLDAATAFVLACCPKLSRERIAELDGESFAALFGFVADKIGAHDRERREALADPLSAASSE